MESRTLPFRPPGPNDADGELSPDSSAMTRLTPDSDSNSGSDSENDSDLDLDMGEVGESFKMQRRGRDVEKGGVGDKEGLNDQDDEEDDYTTTGRRRAASISTVHSYQLYTPDEERAVVRKFDRNLVLFVALLYMLSFLDRSSKSIHAWILYLGFGTVLTGIQTSEMPKSLAWISTLILTPRDMNG